MLFKKRSKTTQNISSPSTAKNPWTWVPSLYFAQGMPYILVIVVSTVIYKNLGLSNSQITLYTGWFYLPWVIKPFWSPIIDHLKTKRYWVVSTQILMGVLMASIGLTLPVDAFIKWSIIFFWLIAFSSATHDIAADGFYMLGLKDHEQSFFVGIRNTAWRIAAIAGQGGLVYITGLLMNNDYTAKDAWTIVLIATGIIYSTIGIYHKYILPKPVSDPEQKLSNGKEAISKYFETIISFFKKKNIVIFLFFVLFYRLGEAQLTKLAAPFLLDERSVGGLGLSNEQVGWAYGTLGVIGLVLGGISGGFVVAKKGLRFWIWPMALAMKLPDLVYIFMAHFQPDNFFLIQSFIAIEQFGYGFGFTAFMLYLIYFVQGLNKTSHYALATGIMALGMMIPGMLSGWIQEIFNYEKFFIWVLLCTIPGLLLIPFLRIDKNYGSNKDR
ncbi:MAG: MFS transporter [Prolixibacteraceae bacterium]|jgi:PAT family beta-lactamase induction signal transducer AmpG|nr:MFS transporter [Prolixibacteraceae bacterium]